jgi:hypothetical protein
MEALIHIVSGVLGAVVAVYFTIKQGVGDPYLAEHVTLSVGLGALVSAAFTIAAGAALERLRESALIDWRSRTLGKWLETVTHPSGTRYAISEISYRRKEHQFQIIGWTYGDTRFDIEEQWHSLCLGFPNENGLYYIYGYGFHRNEHASDRKGIAYMTFLPSKQKRHGFLEGHGYYVDQGLNPHPVAYEFRRIDKELVHRVTGRTTMDDSPEARKEFLIQFSNLHRIARPIMKGEMLSLDSTRSNEQQR